jgi:hypothetical protein
MSSKKSEIAVEAQNEALCRAALEAARQDKNDESLRSNELQQIVRQRGWPKRFRPLLWMKFSGAQSRMNGKQGYYSALIKRKCPLECGPRQVCTCCMFPGVFVDAVLICSPQCRRLSEILAGPCPECGVRKGKKTFFQHQPDKLHFETY